MTADRRFAHSIADIVGALTDRLETLIGELLPAAKRDGPEMEVGSIDGEPGRSLKIHVRHDAKRGVWRDFSAGIGGDVLDLVAAVRCGGNKAEAVRWALDWLGWARFEDGVPGPRPRPAPPPPPPALPDPADERNSGRAVARFAEAKERIAGTLVDRYLQGRGIDLRRLGRQPKALRYHPALWSSEAGGRLPAMVAAISVPGRRMALHRTYLHETRSGVVKASILNPKRTLGAFGGGSIRLWRGASGKPLSEAPELDEIVICEGIEDGLAIALEAPHLRVLAAVSLSNLGRVWLPDQVRHITIFADNDWTKEQAQAGLARAVEAHRRRGRAVTLVRAGGGAKDANDRLLGKTG